MFHWISILYVSVNQTHFYFRAENIWPDVAILMDKSKEERAEGKFSL